MRASKCDLLRLRARRPRCVGLVNVATGFRMGYMGAQGDKPPGKCGFSLLQTMDLLRFRSSERNKRDKRSANKKERRASRDRERKVVL